MTAGDGLPPRTGPATFVFPGALGGTVTMTVGRMPLAPAPHVLCVAHYGPYWLFTRHRDRGIELPGGKAESGERPATTVLRELFEETGALAAAPPLAVARYRIEAAGQEPIDKVVATLPVGLLLPVPPGGDGRARLVLAPPPPAEVQDDPAYSPLLKDGVYPVLHRLLQPPVGGSNRQG